MTTTHSWPKNTWYVACTPDEIAEKPLGRQICGERIVFYRSKEKAVGIADFCPHRGAPLDQGWVSTVQDRACITCPYHGCVISSRSRLMRE